MLRWYSFSQHKQYNLGTQSLVHAAALREQLSTASEIVSCSKVQSSQDTWAQLGLILGHAAEKLLASASWCPQGPAFTFVSQCANSHIAPPQIRTVGPQMCWGHPSIPLGIVHGQCKFWRGPSTTILPSFGIALGTISNARGNDYKD